METNVIVQTALLAVLPLVMQVLKKIPFVEINKVWLCPLLCIIAATGTAYFMQLPQWLLVGVITGAACNKIYDWTKDVKSAIAPVLLVCLLLSASGCSVNSKTDCVNTGRQLTVGTNVCTVVVMSHAAGSMEAATMNTTVHVARNCWGQWYEFVKDSNTIAPDVVTCATSAVFDFLFWQKQYEVTPENMPKLRRETPQIPAIDVSKPTAIKEATDADLEQTKMAYDLAVARFDAAYETYFLTQNKK